MKEKSLQKSLNPYGVIGVYAIISIAAYSTTNLFPALIIGGILLLLTLLVNLEKVVDEMCLIVVFVLAISANTIVAAIMLWILLGILLILYFKDAKKGIINLLLLVVVFMTSLVLAEAQTTKEEFNHFLVEKNLASIKLQKVFVDSVNNANMNTPNFSPHRHIWDYYANQSTHTSSMRLRLLKLHAVEVSELRNKVDSLKNENIYLKIKVDSLQGVIRKLQSTINKPSYELEKGDVIIRHKGLFINTTKNSVISTTLFQICETKMFRINNSVYVYGKAEGVSAKAILVKVKIYKTHILKRDWDRVESIIANN